MDEHGVEVLFQGKHISFLRKGSWEYIERRNITGIVGILPITDAWSFSELIKKLLAQPEYIKKTGEINAFYISKNKGASIQIIDYIRTLL